MTRALESYKKRCLELEKKSENDETRCLMLEVEVEDLKNKNKVLEGKIMEIREVVEVSDGEDEVEKFYDLMTEMKVLECEKQKAESEVYKLKEKVSELMSRVCELESSMNGKAKEDVNVASRSNSKVRKRLPFEDDGCSSKKMAPSTPGVAQTPFSGVIDISDEKVKEDANVVSRFSSKDRKLLPFEDDGCSSKKIAPSTPGVAQTPFSGVIDISDDDEKNDETPENKNISDSSNTASFNKTNLEDFDEEDLDGLKFRCSSSKSAKRKRAANIVPSDDETNDNETSYGDNAQPHSSRHMIDSEDEVTEGASKHCRTRIRNLGSKDNQASNTAAFNKTNLEDFAEEDLDGLKFRCSNSKSAKRKRAANIITSDDETSDNETTYDDDAPICTLMKPRSSRPKIDSEDEVTDGASKRYLTRLRTLESKNKQDTSRLNQNRTVSIDANNSSEDEDDDDHVVGSESEEDRLSDFINDSPEIVSESENASESSDSIEEPENALNDYKETIDNFRRKKVSKYKWDLQGEMQADFGKDPELCMRAVCALYRKQTEDEKASKVTIHHNERGFSQPDADRGSKLAEFLMDGEEDLKKTVEELKMHDPKLIELCTSLALKYSKQLFQIYQNKEDPYFLPE